MKQKITPKPRAVIKPIIQFNPNMVLRVKP